MVTTIALVLEAYRSVFCGSFDITRLVCQLK